MKIGEAIAILKGEVISTGEGFKQEAEEAQRMGASALERQEGVRPRVLEVQTFSEFDDIYTDNVYTCGRCCAGIPRKYGYIYCQHCGGLIDWSGKK